MGKYVRARERESMYVCFFSNHPLMTQRLWNWGGRRKEDDGIWFFGLGLVQKSQGDIVEEGPFPRFVASWNLGGCCLPFLFWLVLWPCTHLDSLSHIHYSLTYQLPFFVDFGSKFVIEYICIYICYHCHHVYLSY